LFDVVQIATITFAQAEDRAAGSEHAFPKMRKRMNPCGEINVDHLGKGLSLGLRGSRHAEEHNPQCRKSKAQKRSSRARGEQRSGDRVVRHDDLVLPRHLLWLHRTLMMIPDVTWAN